MDNGQQTIISVASVVSGVVRDQNQSLAQLRKLVDSNYAPEVMRRKGVRMQLRCLDGQRLYFHYECTKTKTKTRTVTVADDEGTHTETETYTVQVHFTFKHGVFNVGRQGHPAKWESKDGSVRLDMTTGFNCSLGLDDGQGVDHEGKHWTNEHETLGEQKIGITSDYQPNPTFNRLMGGGNNYANVTANMGPLQAKFNMYRKYHYDGFQVREATLSYGFWYYIYNFDQIPRQQLDFVLSKYEENKLMNMLPQKYAADLNIVYQKMGFYNSHPSNAFWFCFWHDMWIHNQALKTIAPHKDIFAPTEAKSLCYRVLPRDELQSLLEEKGLLGSPGCCGCKKGWFNEDVLDQLYSTMDSIQWKQPKPLNELYYNLSANYYFAADFFMTAEALQQRLGQHYIQRQALTWNAPAPVQ